MSGATGTMRVPCAVCRVPGRQARTTWCEHGSGDRLEDRMESAETIDGSAEGTESWR